MYKKILLILGLLTFLYSEIVPMNITANSFIANKQKNFTEFIGEVKMTKEEDYLLCQHLILYTTNNPDTNKTIIKEYIGEGNVSFSFTTTTGTLKGRGDKILYYPQEFKYIVIGNGYLEDSSDGKILIGDTIFIDEKNGEAMIEGTKTEPVKFTLQIETKDNNATN